MKTPEQWLKEVEDSDVLWRASPQDMLAFFKRIQEDAWEEGRSATYKKFIETFVPKAKNW